MIIQIRLGERDLSHILVRFDQKDCWATIELGSENYPAKNCVDYLMALHTLGISYCRHNASIASKILSNSSQPTSYSYC
jgi:hypothetical protein